MISIITVNFRQEDVTISLLESIKEFSDDFNVEVIVVDNGSEKDIEHKLSSILPDVVYIKSSGNLGFAGGNNLGIKAAKGRYLLFLNNDTEISWNLLRELSATLDRNSEIGMVSPLILYYDKPDLIQYAGFTPMNFFTCRNKGVGSLEQNIGQFDNVSNETAYCHGAAMMCRMEDLSEIGLMEENYFLYYEELDWCEKFKRAGKKIWFNGNTHVYHKESITVGKESSIKTYFMTRNRLLFIRRNTNWLTISIFSIYFVGIACPKQVIKYLFSGRTDLIQWLIRGISWNIFNTKKSTKLGYKL